MSRLEKLKKKLQPLFERGETEGNTTIGLSIDPCDSQMVSEGGTVNLQSRSSGVYNIYELGLQKHTGGLVDEVTGETMYRCASHEMHTFGAISRGGSSVVHRAIHIPIHRILALKKINIFEKDKRKQLLNEIQTLCEACCYQGLVEFHGAFCTPGSGQISIVLEYMDGGSLADVLRVKGSIPEKILSYPLEIVAGTQKDPEARPTAAQLLSHPFISKYKNESVSLAEYTRGVFDPTERLKELAEMLAVHYYLLFDGADELWNHTKTFYTQDSTFSLSGKTFVGSDDIFAALSDTRRKLAGDRPSEKLVHVVENLHCRPHEGDGVAIRASGSFIVGTNFLICGSRVQVEGMPDYEELSRDIPSKRMGTFHEQFHMTPASPIGSYMIVKQEMHILQD